MKYLYATAAVAVIGCGVLYLKQVRAAAYDRCYRSLYPGSHAEFADKWGIETVEADEHRDKFSKKLESCTNREMFR